MISKILKSCLFIFFVLDFYRSLAQTCCRVEKSKIDFEIKNRNRGTVFAEAKTEPTGFDLKVINATKDTIYLFNSYLKDCFQSSKYIHRIDSKTKTYTISFIPIIPYIGTKLSDRIISNGNTLTTLGQITYSFSTLPPNSFIDIVLKRNILFENENKLNNAIEDINNQSLNKFSKPHFKYLTTSKLNGGYKLSFQFAYYNNVSLLCNVNSYYLDELNFNNQAKSFKVLNIPVNKAITLPEW